MYFRLLVGTQTVQDTDTYMTAVVPVGATTGPVVVTTPTGTLTSNKSLVIKGSSAGIHRKPPASRSVVKH